MNIKYSILIVLLLSLLCGHSAAAQASHKIEGSNGSLIIKDVKSVTLIGTSSNALTIETSGESKRPEEAKGLKLVNVGGYEDNTGIGLHIEQKDGKYFVNRVSKKRGDRYVISVPKDWFIHYEANGYNVGKLIIEDVAAELDISVDYNKIEATGITGPLSINSVYGPVEITFDELSQNGPTNIYTAYAGIDVYLPKSAKADVEIGTGYGDFYSDIDLDYPTNASGLKNLSSKKRAASLNGGGVHFKVKSSYGTVYLRTIDN